MPELPEVETIKSDLKDFVLDKQIIQINIKNENSVKNKPEFFVNEIKGDIFLNVTRRGKFLIFDFKKSDYFLIAHLRMTGKLLYFKKTKKYPDHARVELIFIDNSKLFFTDIRKFGFLKLMTKQELSILNKRWGIEPLGSEFTLENFTKLLNKKNTNIKAFLLNQNYIAGIGNIYADEICFRAGVLPARKVNSLIETEIKKIYRTIPEILQESIARRGTTFSDYRDSRGKKGNFLDSLKVYKRNGLKCFCCKKIIQKQKIAGRGTHFCLNCQK